LPSTFLSNRRSFRIGLFCSLFGSATAAAQGAPEAATFPLRVAVEAPSGCSDSAAFFARVRRHTSRVREASGDERAKTMQVVLRSEDGQFAGSLTVHDEGGGEGHREVRGADCASVAAGLAFVAAVIVDPAAALGASPDVPAPIGPAEEAVAPAPAASRPLPRDAPTESRSGIPFRLSAGGGVATARGLGPDTAVMGRLFVDLELPGLLRGAYARLSAGRALARSVATSVGTADIEVTDVRLDPCLNVLPPASFELGACGIVDAVILAGSGTNTWQPQDAQRVSIELGLGVRPRWVVWRRFTLQAMIGGAAPVARYRFYFAPDTTAYRLAAVSGFAEFAAGVRFW
jgi:hypothetical protein